MGLYGVNILVKHMWFGEASNFEKKTRIPIQNNSNAKEQQLQNSENRLKSIMFILVEVNLNRTCKISFIWKLLDSALDDLGPLTGPGYSWLFVIEKKWSRYNFPEVGYFLALNSPRNYWLKAFQLDNEMYEELSEEAILRESRILKKTALNHPICPGPEWPKKCLVYQRQEKNSHVLKAPSSMTMVRSLNSTWRLLNKRGRRTFFLLWEGGKVQHDWMMDPVDKPVSWQNNRRTLKW